MENSTQSTKISTLQAEVQGLTLTNTSLRTYLPPGAQPAFLRDKIKKVSRIDAKVIKDGNVAAHEGDSLVDATMFGIGCGRTTRHSVLCP